MLAKLIDHPRLTDRLFRDIRDGVGVRLSLGNHIFFGTSVQQTVKLVGVETEERQVKILLLQFLDLHRQKVVVPLGDLTCFIVRDPVSLHLFWREVVGDMDGNHIQSEPLGGLKSCMAADNDVVFVHDNGRTPAEFLDGIGDRLHRLVIEPGILVVGVDVREFHVCDLH